MPGICEISRLIFIESIYAIENITLQKHNVFWDIQRHDDKIQLFSNIMY